MKMLRPEHVRRLGYLLDRVKSLKYHGVTFNRSQIEALERVINILTHDERMAKMRADYIANQGQPPPDFGVD